jgi:Ferredoxin thioredoxin reductase variable alpha chain
MLKEHVRVMEAEKTEAFPVGTRVRVKQSVIVYHHPEHRNQPFDIKGLEGEVGNILREWQGREVSANYPIYVKFSGKFVTHLQESELEQI